MTPEDYGLLETLFLEACELNLEAQQRLIEERLAGRQDLRTRIEAMRT